MVMPAESEARIIGRYALYGEIASGGMATVHFGKLLGPVGFSRTVAIKRLHPQFAKDPEFVTMFLDEARLAARVQHPNVVSTLDVVSTEEQLFLVMEYVQGEALSKLTRIARERKERIPPHIVAAIVAGFLHGLHAAHEARSARGEPLNIVHRDVSPQNVLVGIDGVARIVDFGVAKAADRVQTTREGQTKGKLSYMAPEQLHGEMVTRQTDVYAAGIVLWESLTGRRLFFGENEGATVVKVMTMPAPPPSSVVADLPAGFDEVTLRALSRDPTQRYATAREMALALEGCIDIALPSETGAWVESRAGVTLSMRAERMARIESDSSIMRVARPPTPLLAITPPGSGPAVASSAPVPSSLEASSPSGVSPSSQVSSLAVAIQNAATTTRGKKIILVVAGGAAVLSVLLAFIFVREPASGAPTIASSMTWSGAAPPAPQESAAAPSAAPASPAVVSATPAAATTAAAAGTSSSTPVPPPSRAAPPQARPTPPSPAPAAPAAVAKARCNPPYTVDATGRKLFKVECL